MLMSLSLVERPSSLGGEIKSTQDIIETGVPCSVHHADLLEKVPYQRFHCIGNIQNRTIGTGVASTVIIVPHFKQICKPHLLDLLHVVIVGIRLNCPKSGGTVMICPLQSHCPANKPLCPAFNAHAHHLQTVVLRAAQCRDVAPGTLDPDPPAMKSVSTSVKGVCFKGLAN